MNHIESEPMETERSELDALSDPFDVSDIEWRLSRSGTGGKGIWCVVLAYVTARAIQKRLDEVCSPGGWRLEKPEAIAVGDAVGFMCGISIRINGEWVTKWDVAEPTNIEPIKGGWSGAMKRAGAQWGIGRYLYHLEEVFADVSDVNKGRAWNYAKDKSAGVFYWKTPNLPGWAMPKQSDFTDEPATVSPSDINELKRAWKANHAENVTSADDLRSGFERFVESIVGEFPVGDASCWTMDAFQKCMDRATQPVSDSGIDTDVPFE